MAKYAIGVDYGTLSGRALLVNVETGEELATSVFPYPHAVMDEFLCGEVPLEPEWALQHPQDYLDVLAHTVPAVLAEAKVDARDVIGVGIDFTACTILPTLQDGTPLCFLDEYKKTPHAYVKLWKHHAAQDEANQINALAEAEGAPWLSRYGGKLSSEWAFAKGLQLCNEAPDIYNKADRFIEATDWVIWQLCGKEMRNACTAGYKECYHPVDGYPAPAFLEKLNPAFKDFAKKLSEDIYPMGTKAGEITESAAKLTGLFAGTAVAVGNVDAHVAIPACGITTAGKLLMIMGTSTCDILLGDSEKIVPGMCGVVKDGVIEGFYGYEAGQSCVGDHFAWFVERCLPADYAAEAKARGISPFVLLTEKASALQVGESGILALDFWNGNRSVLVDTDLSGLFLGMTLLTKPEELYRALIEATAYGARVIIDNFEKYGVSIESLYAAGGIAEKDAFMMQIYADVTGREIRISGSPQAPALGSAMFGALAAGSAAGGFDTIEAAAAKMAKIKDIVYRPIAKNQAMYEKLYAEYVLLHDYFGRGENDVMKRLRAIKKESVC